ncbi:MAG: hypothetical protein BroJett030_21660 [Alphaproteobacteria bacterium]|nr:MAG: hypothetical protein BroJett030_21660 [Alphaproteobacteria bacterium]
MGKPALLDRVGRQRGDVLEANQARIGEEDAEPQCEREDPGPGATQKRASRQVRNTQNPTPDRHFRQFEFDRRAA